MILAPRKVRLFSLLGFLLIFFAANASGNKEGYYGRYIGKLSQLHHGVSGDVFAVDARTLHLRNFNYDGEGPAAYFYAGSTKGPGAGGFRLRDERGTTNVLPKYRNKHLTITLPEGKTLQNVRWFSVWCDEFSVNFGDVKIPKNLDFPKPQKINGLGGVHGVSSEPIVIVDAQTLLVPSFSYDGEAPDAKFWVGSGPKPSPRGVRIPDENGSIRPLRRYDRKTVVLTLPGDLTVFDVGHFGVWCEAFAVDFGHVQIPGGLNVPPSLKMLGVSPQSKLNCEVLWDDFAYEVRWAVAGDSIVLQLVARLENNEYMSFGLSGDDSRSRMVGGDVVVAWVDKDTLKGHAQDYYLDAKSQCSGGRGSCPDENVAAGTDSVRLLNAALVNGYSIVTFQRSLRARDELDKPVLTNASQPIVWAVGPLNSRKEVSYHSLANRGDVFIDFGRSPKWNCPTPESSSDRSEAEEEEEEEERPLPRDGESEETRIEDSRNQDSGRRSSRPKTQIPTPAPAPKTDAWEIPAIKCYEPEDGVFYAQMGPTGGKRGYSAITGHVGWGISWYINGLLIPEINVVRGRTYTFIVEGGLDPETPARYHPFYITDDPVGGYEHKTPRERANIQIFAGAVQNKRGEVRPTGVGRLCNWTPDPNQPPADEFASFGAYQRTLRLECDPGNPGIIQWTVEKDTPDTVYYQCYTHRYLGWKINVRDHCEGESASEPVASVAEAPARPVDSHRTDVEGYESIDREIRIEPDREFLENLLRKNQTLSADEFLVHRSVFKFRPEFHDGEIPEKSSATVKPGEEALALKQEFGNKNPHFKHQVIEDLNAQRVRSHYSRITALQHRTSDLPRQPPPPSPPVTEENSVRIPKVTHVPGLSLYSVNEEPSEENDRNGFRNFQIVPATNRALLRGSNNQNHVPEPFRIQPFQERQRQKLLSSHPPDHRQITVDDHLQALGGRRPEQKFNKHNLKLQHRNKSTASSNSFPKPFPQGPFTLQQRPVPTGTLLPPAVPRRNSDAMKSSKRPATAFDGRKVQHLVRLVKTPSDRPHHRRLDGGKTPDELQRFKFRLPERSSSFPERESVASSALPSASASENVPFARNAGFDPESIKVEGGFKPILNEGAAPKSDLVDGADSDVRDENDDGIGVVDSTIGEDDSENPSRRRRRLREEKPRERSELDSTDRNGPEERNPFENLKPQPFEPVFVPSFPDNTVKKYKKKPIFLVRDRDDRPHPQDYYREGESVPVEIGPATDPNGRRPFHPDESIPPFEIPLRGGVTHSRYGQSDRSDESVEESHAAAATTTTTTTTTGASGNRENGPENIYEFAKTSDDENRDERKGADPEIGDTSVLPDEVAMADERKEFFYLPPKKNKYLAYDGKVVDAELAAPELPISNPTSADVSKLPRFVPFKGAIPPLTRTVVNAQNLPQLKNSQLARQDILPPSEARRGKRSADHVPGHEGHDHRDRDPHVRAGAGSPGVHPFISSLVFLLFAYECLQGYF